MRLRTTGRPLHAARVFAAAGSGASPDAGERTVSLRRVLPYVLYAALGALLFGYHLGVVNSALEPLSAELNIVSAGAKGAVRLSFVCDAAVLRCSRAESMLTAHATCLAGASARRGEAALRRPPLAGRW